VRLSIGGYGLLSSRSASWAQPEVVFTNCTVAAFSD
jgi:hypothetical protein